MNKVILIGRLVREPDLRYTPNGKAVCSFTIAVNRPYNSDKAEQEADFINCVVWNKIAENVAKYLKKGSQCGVDGRLQIRSYDDKEGKRKYITEVIANNVEFLGSGNGGNKAQKKQGQDVVDSGAGYEVSFSDEDLPF